MIYLGAKTRKRNHFAEKVSLLKMHWGHSACAFAIEGESAIVSQSWALEVFLSFFNNEKWFFAFFIKLIWPGVGFLNRTGAEMAY